MNDAQCGTNFTGGDAIRRMPDKKAENIEPGFVAQSRERIDCNHFIHISRLMDILIDCNLVTDPIAVPRSVSRLISLKLVPSANALGGSEDRVGVQAVMGVNLADRPRLAEMLDAECADLVAPDGAQP